MGTMCRASGCPDRDAYGNFGWPVLTFLAVPTLLARFPYILLPTAPSMRSLPVRIPEMGVTWGTTHIGAVTHPEILTISKATSAGVLGATIFQQPTQTWPHDDDF
ncbi:hypothetical protein CC2G_011799 [Coprinopsis cinerea AmutBmut pab1-1]|nr:hypothetical protein CC2G_011799 [Coprinopsis cinerea AmutBmut pab1-1]